MKLFFTFTLIFLICGSALAQDSSVTYARNNIFVEGLGHGVLYSINGERFFTPNFGVRVGFTSWKIEELAVTAFPVSLTYLIGKSNHHLELGIGLMPGRVDWDFIKTSKFTFLSMHGTGIWGIATIGYRYQRPEGGQSIRFSFTPIIGKNKIQPWPGISMGYAF